METNDQKEFKVGLIAAFKGVKFLPNPFVLGSNNFSPKLILRENEIEYRNLFFTSKKSYGDIQEVDIYLNDLKIAGFTTTNICLYFKNSIFTFLGNLNNKEKLRELVILFKKKNCKLSDKAKKIIEEEI